MNQLATIFQLYKEFLHCVLFNGLASHIRSLNISLRVFIQTNARPLKSLCQIASRSVLWFFS